LKQYKSPLGYLHKGNDSVCNKPVYLKSISFVGLDSISKVTHMYGFAIPLLVYNYFETNKKVVLGQNSMDKNYSQFFKESLIERSKRSGLIQIINEDTIRFNDYNLEILIDTCITKARYKEKTTIMVSSTFISYSMYAGSFPSETYISIKLKIRNGNNIVLEKKYKVSKIQNYPFQFDNIGFDESNSPLITNMVESLSLSTKDIIDEMVIDIINSVKDN